MDHIEVAKRETLLGARSTVALIVFAVLLLFASALVIPSKAYAKSYDMPEVTIDAQIESNGDLQVVEQRQFDFTGDFSAVWWNYSSLPSGAKLSINGMRMAHVDDSGAVVDDWVNLPSVPFQMDWREEGGPSKTAYSYDAPQKTVYAFFDESDSRVVFEVSYTVKDAVQAYSDVGELYWQFVGSAWQEDSSNIDLKVSLPAPSGTQIDPGENVRAWGHGPLDASVTINDDATVTYSVPHVNAGSYAEARILFPTEWLTQVAPEDDNAHFSTAHLENVLNEERTWADHANAERMESLVLILVVVLVCLVLLIWGLRSFMRYGKELKPSFNESYWRDVPLKGEHPAVIGRLCRFNKESTVDLTATIMHLADLGALTISQGTYEKKGILGTKAEDDFYLVRKRDVELGLNSEIDRSAMHLLFDVVAAGRDEMHLSEIKEAARSCPSAFSNAVEDWQGIVTSHVSVGEYFETYSTIKRSRMFIVAVILLVACVVTAFVFGNPIVVVPGLFTGIVLVIVSKFMDRRTQKGADVYARCVALKKWLSDFSTLGERPPSDIKVWGEFMVYALLFGVAKEAMEQLEKAVPEMAGDYSSMDSAGYIPWWVWYSSSWHIAHPGSSMLDLGSALDSALSSSIASSTSAVSGNFSSAGGFGGGFSAGGGGGFGGGGGAR